MTFAYALNGELYDKLGTGFGSDGAIAVVLPR